MNVILSGSPPIEVALRPNARARRLSLRVSRLDGRVTLSLPAGVPVAEARAFVEEKEGWIRRHMASAPDAERVGIGGEILIEGRRRRIAPAADGAFGIDGNVVHVPGPPANAPLRLRACLKELAAERLCAASDRYAGRIGRRYGRITLRDTRSRWGSCSRQGNLMYSWRLIMAPPEALDYVAAHEVAHLAHMDHSPAFWGVVERLFPNHAVPGNWLRKNGAELHRFKFD